MMNTHTDSVCEMLCEKHGGVTILSTWLLKLFCKQAFAGRD